MLVLLAGLRNNEIRKNKLSPLLGKTSSLLSLINLALQKLATINVCGVRRTVTGPTNVICPHLDLIRNIKRKLSLGCNSRVKL